MALQIGIVATPRHCPYCDAHHSSKLYETLDMYGNEFSVHQCRECNTVFLSRYPTPQQLEQAYSVSYDGEQEQKFTSLVERVVEYFRKQRAKTISNYIPASAKVLDIGCGNGRFLHHLLKLGNYEAHGIELPGKAAERAAKVKGLVLKEGKLQPDDFSDAFFDAVTMFHVIEHLDQPRETLQTIGQIVKPGGIAYISMPNIDSWQSRLFKGKWLHLRPSDARKRRARQLRRPRHGPGDGAAGERPGVAVLLGGIAQRRDVPYEIAIGLALSDDGGESFRRIGEGPVLGASARDPYFVSTPFVWRDGTRWRAILEVAIVIPSRHTVTAICDTGSTQLHHAGRRG